MNSLESLTSQARVFASRWGFALLDRSPPALAGELPGKIAGKWATNLFMETRRGGRDLPVGIPAGATAKPVRDGEKVRNVYVWGKSGPMVVLVHGWGADSAAMCSLVRPLRQRGYRVVAFDGPAHGSNQGRRTTMTEFVASVREVLERFDPAAEVRAIVGHSLGGLAAVAASKLSQRVPERMVLLSAPSCLNEALRSFVGFWGISSRIEQQIRKELSRSHGVPIEHWDVRTLASRDRFPALVLHDQDDSFVPFAQADIVANALGSTARIELTKGLGHARILADQRTTSLVADFVAGAQAA
ncbi:alpha/beta hydrolase [Pendulispora albinea]|uniref:Alpha/beta hydrolase n=1 Tax=Pendulispora albinea TaxID=2741071 RepID=A0ABZ2LVB0_9BACT